MSKPVLITYRGETKPMAEWAREAGIDQATFWNRYRKTGDMDYCMNVPVKRATTYPYNGRRYTAIQLAKLNGTITPGGIDTRLRRGWSIEDIVNVKNRRLDKNTVWGRNTKKKPTGCTHPDCDRCPFSDCRY